jgi:hypothetical protein
MVKKVRMSIKALSAGALLYQGCAGSGIRYPVKFRHPALSGIRYKFAGYLPDSTVTYFVTIMKRKSLLGVCETRTIFTSPIVKHEQLLSMRRITTKLRHIFS